MQSANVEKKRSWVRIPGRILSLAGLGWMAWAVWQHREVLFRGDPVLLTVFLLGGGLVYALCSTLLPVAWIALLPARLERSLNIRLFHHYCVTQVGKYIPGNIFHFVGRQSAGSWPGISHTAAALATLLENILLIGAAALLAAIPWLMHHQDEGPLSPLVLAVLIGSSLLIPSLVWWAAARIRPEIREHFGTWPIFTRRCLVAFTLYLVFFSGVSLCFSAFNRGLGDAAIVALPLADFFWIYPAVWIAGFITPGAPGGLGVREALLVAALEPKAGGPHALEIAILFRMVTMLGDLLIYGLGKGAPGRAKT